MNEMQTTQLIIGQSRRPLWRALFKESFVHYLLRHARHMDMLIVAVHTPIVE
jgi:two-component system sensor histidine kinase KdpD